MQAESVGDQFRLFLLEPLGRPSGRVESLTGYATRLAQAHSLPSDRLLNKIRLRLLANGRQAPGRWPIHPSGMSTMNGSGRTFDTWRLELEALTGVGSLLDLTTGSWLDALPPQHLLRREAAYCPACFADDLLQGEPHERLVWMVREVTYAPFMGPNS